MLVIGSFSHVPFTWADKGKWITPLFPCDKDHILLRSILYCVVLPYCAHCICPMCFDYSFFFSPYIYMFYCLLKKKNTSCWCEWPQKKFCRPSSGIFLPYSWLSTSIPVKYLTILTMIIAAAMDTFSGKNWENWKIRDVMPLTMLMTILSCTRLQTFFSCYFIKLHISGWWWFIIFVYPWRWMMYDLFQDVCILEYQNMPYLKITNFLVFLI